MEQLTAGERLALLKDKHGTFKQVQEAELSTSWFVYNDEGDILYKGINKPDMRRYKGSKAVEINQEEYAFVDEMGKSVGQFIIEEDEHDVIRIVPRPIEKPTLKSDRDFLYEIPRSDALDYDVSITVGSKWTIEVAEPSKVKTNLYFYITAPQDPHVLLEKVVAKLEDLRTGTVNIERKTAINDFSIYTHKLLDKYVRS
tara:strand:- start:4525 stop:5121 length:597 start_codon:yes stop_codon:yes gene_type:complete